MDNLAYKYNRYIILFIVFAPFISYLSFNILDITYGRILQFLSFVGLFLIIMFKGKNDPLIIPNYFYPLLLFTLYVFYSAFFQLDRTFKVNYLFSNHLIGSLNLILIIENLPISKRFYTKVYTYSKYILLVALVVIVIQQVYSNEFYMNNDEEIDATFLLGESKIRLKSIYSFLGYLTMGFGFVPVFIWVVENLKKVNKNVLIWIVIGITYAFLTKARWLMINILLVFVVYVIHDRYKMRQIMKVVLLVPLIGIMSYFTLNAVGVDAEKIVNERILENDKTNDHKSATTRLLAFKVFNKLYWDNAIFGVGSIKYGMGASGQHEYRLSSQLGQRSSQIHVGYLSLFYMYGLVGGIMYLSFLFLLLRKLYNDALKTKVWAPLLAFIGFALMNFTQVHFPIFEMGLLLMLFANKFHLQKQEYLDA